MKMYTKRTPIKASKDYSDLKGMDFTKARDLLTKDGFHEHEYGDKDNNNGYAVYRKGDKEVELQYRWIPGKRKGDAHAGKVTNVYVDENIYGAAKGRSRRAIKASGRQFLFPFLVEGKFADGFTCEVSGRNEAECVEDLGNMQDRHGELVWYSGVTDENYENGRLINSSTKAISRRAIKASTAPKRYEVAIDRGENDPLLVKFFDNKDDASKYADSVHDRGFAVRITDNETGETEELGEFENYWNTMTDVESSVCASTSNQIPYDMVSTLVILRDYANVEDEDYINNEHKLLVDIADTLYNVGRGMVTNFSGEYKNLYELYGEDYFDKVLDDVSAIDSQMSDQNLNDLIEEYNNKITAY